jgi:hypothetical protein
MSDQSKKPTPPDDHPLVNIALDTMWTSVVASAAIEGEVDPLDPNLGMRPPVSLNEMDISEEDWNRFKRRMCGLEE